MIFQNDPSKIKDWTANELSKLPQNEDDAHEYKSSRIDKKNLKKSIRKAASGFWNSGGGLLVIGVKDNGEPDGGVSCFVGNISRRDWIDQVILDVKPQAEYAIHKIGNLNSKINIDQDGAVFLIAFGESKIGPHMAPDNVYYMRAGAHTVPAPHFITEAIYARRGLSHPALKPTFRRKPKDQRVVQLGIIALNEAPALEVKINFKNNPPIYDVISHMKEDNISPLELGVINQTNPFYMDYAVTYRDEYFDKEVICMIEYKDLVGNNIENEFRLVASEEIVPALTNTSPLDKIEKHLKRIKNKIK